MKNNNLLNALIAVFWGIIMSMILASCEPESLPEGNGQTLAGEDNPPISCEMQDICSITVSLEDLNVSGVTFKGKADVRVPGIEFGILYSIEEKISYENSSRAIVKDIYEGEYEIVVSDLEPGMQYYYTAYIRYNDTNKYGKILSFTTPSFAAPVLSDITESTVCVECSSPILSGGEPVFNGIALEISYESDGFDFDVWKTLHISKEETEGVFKQLSPNTTYYIRAWGMASGKKIYSETVQFTTKEVDLSAAVNLSDSGTANCYIVPPSSSGIYCIDAVEGNSDIPVKGERAEVLWENKYIFEYKVECSLIKWVYYYDGKVYFETLSGGGNALIFVDGESAWSWHIWRGSFEDEEYSNGAVFMNTNLGEVEAERRLAFQWGRKEPFPVYSEDPANLVDLSVYYENNKLSTESSSYWSMSSAVDEPTVFLDWTGYDYEDWLGYSDRWSGEKTKYDPCPAGYIVPPSDAWDGCELSDFSSSYYSTLGYYTFKNNDIFDPWRLHYNNYNDQYSYYWTNTIDTESSGAKMLVIRENTGSFWITSNNPSVGAVVRCMKEGHGPRHMNDNLSFTIELLSLNDTEATISVEHNGTETDSWHAFISTKSSLSAAIDEEFRFGSPSKPDWQPVSYSKAYTTFTDLQPATNYYCYVVGVTDYGKVYGQAASLQIKTYNRDYASWLGSWTFTGENGISFDIDLVADVPDKSYHMYGWEGFNVPIKVDWHSNRKHWVIYVQNLGKYDFGELGLGEGDLWIGGVNYYSNSAMMDDGRPLMIGDVSGLEYYAEVDTYGNGISNCYNCSDTDYEDTIEHMRILAAPYAEDQVYAFIDKDKMPSGKISIKPRSDSTKSMQKVGAKKVMKSPCVAHALRPL